MLFAARQIGLRRGTIDIFTSNVDQPVTTVQLVGTGLAYASAEAEKGHNYVAIRTGESRVRRVRTDASGQFALNLPPGTRYSYTAFDPETGLVNQQYDVVPADGQLTQRVADGFLASTAADRDGDGLPDDVEFAIGSDPDQPDSNQDGIDDGRSLDQAIDLLQRNLQTVIVRAKNISLVDEPLAAEGPVAARALSTVLPARPSVAQLAAVSRHAPLGAEPVPNDPLAAGEDEIVAGPLHNGNFETDDPAAAEFAWTRRGTVTIADGSATLEEDLQYFSGLSQIFLLPEDTQQLRFQIQSLEFGPQDDFARTGRVRSFPAGCGYAAADRRLRRVAERHRRAVEHPIDGRKSISDSSVTVPGAAESGELADLQWPIDVTIQLGDAPRDRPALLLFDLLGFGQVGSRAVIDNVRFVQHGVLIEPMTGLETSEDGGATQVQVSLTWPPTADVTFSLTSTDETEGAVTPAQLTFTPANWDQPQTVVITGVDDSEWDGDVAYQIQLGAATSEDPAYQGLDAEDLSLINIDDDFAEPDIIVTPTDGLEVTEAGDTTQFTVELTAPPTADVTVRLFSSNTAEGTITPSIVVFAPENWDTPVPVVVTGIDDPIADGDVEFAVITAWATSIDRRYHGKNPADVRLVNRDNDVELPPGIVVEPTEGLVTTEDGGTAEFSVVLTARPTHDVIVRVVSSDRLEGTVAPASLTFQPDNWHLPQTVVVTGASDAFADGDRVYTVITSWAESLDRRYHGINADDVRVTNVDTDLVRRCCWYGRC